MNNPNLAYSTSVLKFKNHAPIASEQKQILRFIAEIRKKNMAEETKLQFFVKQMERKKNVCLNHDPYVFLVESNEYSHD